MKNVIYRITNTINQKVYIGQTTQGLKKRKGEHVYRFNRGERDHKLYLAFKKYGIDSFVFESICTALKSEYLNELEQQLISEYNSFSKGYNMTIGGDAVSQETRDKLSKIFRGRKITWYDKILESRAKNPNDLRQKYHLLQKEGVTFEVHNLTKFCRENDLDIANLYHTRNSKKTHKGYLLLESSTTSRKA